MTRLNSTHAFYLMWLVIVFVSAHDGCLVLANRPTMSSVEQNPLGHWLIHVWGDDIWLLLMVKAAGTIAVASFLLVLYSVYPRIAWTVCARWPHFNWPCCSTCTSRNHISGNVRLAGYLVGHVRCDTAHSFAD